MICHMRHRILQVIATPASLRAELQREHPPLLFDVEPMLVDWDASSRELEEAVFELARQIPPTRAVGLVTNSRRAVPASLPPHWVYRNRAHKPFCRLPRAWQGATVIGDQPLLDGLIAWRLQGCFARVLLPPDAPPIARLQLILGDIFCGAFIHAVAK